MLSKFHIQTKPSICGPIAIFNATRGINMQSKYSLNQLVKMCRSATEHLNNYRGTKPEDFEHVLKEVFPDKKVQRISSRSLKKSKVYSNMIVLYAKENGHAHYAYVKKFDFNSISDSIDPYYLINHDNEMMNDGIMRYKNLDELLEYLMEYRQDKWNLYRYPIFWSII